MAIKIDVHFDPNNGGIIDRCGNTWIAMGTPDLSHEGKFHTNSYTGKRTANYHTDTPINVDIGTGDFTIEAWVWSDLKDQNAGIIQVTDVVGGLYNSAIQSLALGGYYSHFDGGNFIDRNMGTGYWVHKALVRYNGTVRCYINGKRTYQYQNSNYNYKVKYAVIGMYYTTDYYWNGHIDSIRLANHAIYKDNFTPKKFTDIKYLWLKGKEVYKVR